MYDMYGWLSDLFPFNRSLTGAGVENTLRYLDLLNPGLSIISFESGERVFDWVVPKVWSINEAWLMHVESGTVFCNFADNNLHVVGYSVGVDITLDRDQLFKHLFTDDSMENAIPYVTSYYNEAWGFCTSEVIKRDLPPGDYRAYIDSSHFDGSMILGEMLIPGVVEDEIFFSTYICHPSMANNELSGPVVQSALIRYIREYYKKPYYSYRFVFVPETIGSIAYLSRNLENLKEKVLCGFVLSCVGDDRSFSHVQSRFGDALSDVALESALIGCSNVKTYSFLDRGSDERQYCSPGVDLPVSGFCRSKYGEFPEYHTSLDNLDFVSQSGLEGAFGVMKAIIDAFEVGLYPKGNTLCEPQLGRRGLYPTISKKNGYDAVKLRMDLLAYADGVNSIFEISRLINQPLASVVGEVDELIKANLMFRS